MTKYYYHDLLMALGAHQENTTYSGEIGYFHGFWNPRRTLFFFPAGPLFVIKDNTQEEWNSQNHVAIPMPTTLEEVMYLYSPPSQLIL